MNSYESGSFESRISFDCPNCGSPVVEIIPLPETNWSSEHVDEQLPAGEAESICGQCTEEYQLSVQNFGGGIVARLVGHPEVDIAATDAYWVEDPEDLNQALEVPHVPSAILRETLADVDEVMKGQAGAIYQDTLCRMAFVQQFAALEAYLADTLTRQVLDRPEILSRALAEIQELKEAKLTLAAIASNPDIVKVTAANYFRSLLYHNFKKVDAIWKATLQFSIFPSKRLRERMFRAEPVRHDCVHRNGKDKDGIDRPGIDPAFVAGFRSDIHTLLEHIEGQLDPSLLEIPF